MSYYVNLEALIGKKTAPDWLPREANSLAALTGCDPRSGALYAVTSMAALVGVAPRYLETIIRTDSTASFVWHLKYENERGKPEIQYYVTMPGSLTTWWEARRARIESEQRDRMKRIGVRWETATKVSGGPACSGSA